MGVTSFLLVPEWKTTSFEASPPFLQQLYFNQLATGLPVAEKPGASAQPLR